MAIGAFTILHPINAACAVILSSFLGTEPLADLAHLLGLKLSEGIAEKFLDIEKGSLAEAVILALRSALTKIRKAHSEEIKQNGWTRWFRNWDSACASVKQHRWSDMGSLARSLLDLNAHRENWKDLRDTLELLDWSQRVAGVDANLDRMPEDLAELLETQLPTNFIDELKVILAEWPRAHVEVTFAREALPSRIGRKLNGSEDPRLRPMRGFFTGRNREVAAVVEFLLGTEKLAVVTGLLYSVRGAPGIGKTELCKAALREFLRARPNCRTYYVNVTGVRSEESLCAVLADALGNQRLAMDRPTLIAELEKQADLVYLDNLEDALSEEGCVEVFQLLEDIAQVKVKVLASSRRTLGSLAHEFQLGRLSLDDATETFLHFWGAADGETVLGHAELRMFIENDLECHALTVRLLASLGRQERTWQHLRGTWRKFRTRAAQDAGRVDRLSNLELSIRLSFDRATQPAARALWIAMACFPGGMCAAAQAAIVPSETERREAILLLSDRLSVLDQREDRLEMTAPLRQFAAGVEATDAIPVWERCLKYFEGVASKARSFEPSAEANGFAVQTLEREFVNVRESILLAIERGISIDLVEELHRALFNMYEHFTVASIELLSSMAGFFSVHDRQWAWALALEVIGRIEMYAGNVTGSRDHFQQSLRLFAAEGNDLGRARVLEGLGDLEFYLGNSALAEECFKSALGLYKSERSHQGSAIVHRRLAAVYMRLGNQKKAARRLKCALKIYKSTRNDYDRAAVLLSLGYLESELCGVMGSWQRFKNALLRIGPGRHQEADNSSSPSVSAAKSHYEEALQISRIAKNSLTAGAALRALGDLDILLGNPGAALDRYLEAVAIVDSLSILGDLGTTLARISYLHWAAGERVKAEEFAERARSAASASRSQPRIEETEWILELATEEAIT